MCTAELRAEEEEVTVTVVEVEVTTGEEESM